MLAGAPGLLLALLLSFAEEPRNNNFRFSFVFHFNNFYFRLSFERCFLHHPNKWKHVIELTSSSNKKLEALGKSGEGVQWQRDR